MLYVLFFCSGLSGLIYQVVWVRVFANVFGNTIYSASLVIAVFMLGLGVLTLRLPFVHRPAVSFLTSPALGSFSRDLPSLRDLPGACAPFVHLSMAFAGRFITVD
jgi:predicted membrane-bound spermidine synthase